MNKIISGRGSAGENKFDTCVAFSPVLKKCDFLQMQDYQGSAGGNALEPFLLAVVEIIVENDFEEGKYESNPVGREEP